MTGWGDEDVLLCLKEELTEDYECEFVDSLLETLEAAVVDAIVVISEASVCQQYNFSVQQDAAKRLIDEKNALKLQQHHEFNERQKQLQCNIHELKKEINSLKEKLIKNQQVLAEKREILHQKECLLNEQNRALMSLDRTKKSFELALTWYSKYLGLTFSRDFTNECKCNLILNVGDTLTRLELLRDKEGLKFDDSATMTSKSAIIGHLCRIRSDNNSTAEVKELK